jgi:hypothetical protein
VYETSSVDVAVASLKATVPDAMEQIISHDYNRKFEFPPWFSNTLRCYIGKKSHFNSHLKRKDQIIFMTNSPSKVSLLKHYPG